MNAPNKPSNKEDEFFALEESEKLRKMHAQKAAALSAAQRQEAKQLHHMKCPKCGSDLQEMAFKDAQVDKCFGCGGVWLDTGELEHLAGADHSYVGAILDFFRK